MCLGIPGKVVATYREHDVLMGKVDFSGVSKRVCLEHVPQVQPGDYVLVHVGFALSRIDETEARQVFEFLEKMNQLDELKIDSPPTPLRGRGAGGQGFLSPPLPPWERGPGGEGTAQ
jgi:hydrogenase expression/formation protein HypC